MPYTETYAATLYSRLCAKLRAGARESRDRLLEDTRLVVLYAEKGDGSEESLLDRFKVEALLAPFGRQVVGDSFGVTGNQRGRTANRLVRDARRAVRHAELMLDEIVWDVTNRDSRTCLLLPPRTFGRQMDSVFDYLKSAAARRTPKKDFGAGLKGLSESMPKRREGKRWYFVNQRSIVFRGQSKSGPRRSLPPNWEDARHEPSCVIRGRLRCGAAFDPRFHYDCRVPQSYSGTFPNCHGDGSRIPRGQAHVNVAPNDNVPAM